MANVTRNDVYNHFGEAFADRMPSTGEAEIGMSHASMFVRMGDQVFSIRIEEAKQFADAPDPVQAAKDFMATLPFTFRSPD